MEATLDQIKRMPDHHSRYHTKQIGNDDKYRTQYQMVLVFKKILIQMREVFHSEWPKNAFQIAIIQSSNGIVF